ncbi:hypothetical protein [Streptomyces bauhiniae]
MNTVDAVREVVATIPRGRVVSYGDIAGRRGPRPMSTRTPTIGRHRWAG